MPGQTYDQNNYGDDEHYQDQHQNNQTNKNGSHIIKSGYDEKFEKIDNSVPQHQSQSISKRRSKSKTKREQRSKSRQRRFSRKDKDRSTSSDRFKAKHRSSSRSLSRASTKKYHKKRRNRSDSRSRSRNRSVSRSRSVNKRYGSSSSFKQTWWQSLKPQQIIQEPQKMWDGFQWVVRNPSSDINSGMISQARKDRRLYIGNLPSDVPPEQLRDFMENVLRGYIQIPGDIEKVVLAAWIGPTGTFGFIEVATVEIAIFALGLGRIEFNGSMLRISRPNDYQEQANLGFLASVINKTT